MKLIVSLGLGAAGVALLVWGAERLVKAVRVRAALVGVSALVLGLLATSADLESTAAGISAAGKGLETVAAGISLGSVVFLATAALGVAAFLFPFSVRTPRSFLAAMLSAAVAAGLALMDGAIGRLEGVGLLALFTVLLVGTSRHLRAQPGPQRPAPDTGTTLVRTRTRFLVAVVGSLVAMTVGAELLAESVRLARSSVTRWASPWAAGSASRCSPHVSDGAWSSLSIASAPRS